MDTTAKSILLKLACLLAAVVVAVGLQAREQANGNLYAYAVEASDVDPHCRYDFVDLARDGSILPMSVATPDAASDDRGTVVALQQPFEFYQSPAQALVASDNGYLATADSLEREDGSDFSNDCELPVLADNPSASQNRIYLYHDDLRPQAGGSLRQAYFPACPRVGGSGRPEACTVIEWNGFERAGPIPSTTPLVAQAVLYHDSHEIALQYASVDDSQGSQATIGLQGLEGRAGRTLGCNAPRRVQANRAVCFFDPRQRPGDSLLGLGVPRWR